MTTIASMEPFVVRVGHRNQTLLKVTTDDGLHGWGEAGLSSREGAVLGAIEHFARFLTGQDSRRIGRIWQETYRSQYFEGGRVLTAALSAIDIALHDLAGKRLNVPVHELLGGRHREVIPTFASCTAETTEGTVDQARRLIDDGWDCIRLAPAHDEHTTVFDPRASLAPTAERLHRVRDEIGPGVALGIDYHHRLSVAEAARFCALLAPGTIDFLEEPIRDETPDAYRVLRSMTDIPFAVGEEFASKWQAGPYLDHGLTQFMRLDVCNVGGFTEAMKVAGWCERHYVDLMPHNPLGPVCTAATAHLAAAVPNLSWVETRQSPVEALGFHDRELFPVQVELDGAVQIVPDGPGLGVEVDEELVRRRVASPVESPHLRRPDGSVTNW